MAESTARAERFENAPLYYRWEVPQKPLAIRLRLDVAERLDREAVASFRSVTDRGSEIGGVLLGRTIPGTPAVVVVEDYERIPCDYTRGPLYRLGPEDKSRFAAALRRHAAAPAGSPAVVGMFRSNTRKGLSLDAEDLALFGEHFGGPQQVALLVRPFATKPSAAGFFVRENGTVDGDASPLEFALSLPEMLERSTAMETDRSAAAEAPPAARQAPRAQVVPIATRGASAPRPAPPAAAPVEVPETPAIPEPPVVKPPEPKLDAAPAHSADSATEQPRTPAASEKQEPPAVEAPAAVHAKEEAETPPAFKVPFGGAPEAPAPRNGRWIWGIGAGVAALLLSGTLFFYPGLVRRGTVPVAAPVAPGSLDLRVERNAGQLLLSWNRESEVIKSASKAVLTIVDGPQHENVDLDLAQLRNGTVVYSPATSDVNFRLDVTNTRAELNRSELVRVLGTKPSPMPVAGAPDAGKILPGGAEPMTQPGDTSAVAPEVSPIPAPVPRKMLALAERLRPAKPEELPEPPALAGGVSLVASALPFTNTRMPAPPSAPAAPIATTPGPAPAAPASNAVPRTGGIVREAQLVRRVEPIYPAVARQARITGNVELLATVGPNGKVKKVQVTSGHPLLAQAAADAVAKWTYSPTLLNGAPVEVVTHVTIAFNMAH